MEVFVVLQRRANRHVVLGRELDPLRLGSRLDDLLNLAAHALIWLAGDREIDWAAVLLIDEVFSSRHLAEVAPEVRAKVCGQGGGVASDEDAHKYKSQQSRDLRKGKYILDKRTSLNAKNVDDRERDDHEDGHQVLSTDADIHIAQRH